jgi:hypothetical protein
MFQIKLVEVIETHVIFNTFFFRKLCFIRDNVENYGTVRHATDENTVQKSSDLHVGYVRQEYRTHP